MIRSLEHELRTSPHLRRPTETDLSADALGAQLQKVLAGSRLRVERQVFCAALRQAEAEASASAARERDLRAQLSVTQLLTSDLASLGDQLRVAKNKLKARDAEAGEVVAAADELQQQSVGLAAALAEARADRDALQQELESWRAPPAPSSSSASPKSAPTLGCRRRRASRRRGRRRATRQRRPTRSTPPPTPPTRPPRTMATLRRAASSRARSHSTSRCFRRMRRRRRHRCRRRPARCRPASPSSRRSSPPPTPPAPSSTASSKRRARAAAAERALQRRPDADGSAAEVAALRELLQMALAMCDDALRHAAAASPAADVASARRALEGCAAAAARCAAR